jgi:signal peptidase I
MRKLGRGLFWVALVLGILVGVARLTAIRWWRIPADDPYLEASIAPTLRGGDLIILWRLGKPHFGDLVICPEPKRPDRIVIGRIAGEGGDDIKVDGAKATINGRAAETEHACDPNRFTVTHPTTHQDVEQDCQVEAIAGVSHMRGGVLGAGVLPAPVDQKIAEGKVFLLSDNRLLPYDSREFGLVDQDTCTEMVLFRLVSAKGFFDEKARFTFIK